MACLREGNPPETPAGVMTSSMTSPEGRSQAHLMSSEALCRRVALPTLAAAEWLLLRVAELVLLQVAHLEEPLPTAGAPVPPLPGPAHRARRHGDGSGWRGRGGLGGELAPVCRFGGVLGGSASDLVEPVDPSGFSSQAGAAAESRSSRAHLSDLHR